MPTWLQIFSLIISVSALSLSAYNIFSNIKSSRVRQLSEVIKQITDIKVYFSALLRDVNNGNIASALHGDDFDKNEFMGDLRETMDMIEEVLDLAKCYHTDCFDKFLKVPDFRGVESISIKVHELLEKKSHLSKMHEKLISSREKR